MGLTTDQGFSLSYSIFHISVNTSVNERHSKVLIRQRTFLQIPDQILCQLVYFVSMPYNGRLTFLRLWKRTRISSWKCVNALYQATLTFSVAPWIPIFRSVSMPCGGQHTFLLCSCNPGDSLLQYLYYILLLSSAQEKLL